MKVNKYNVNILWKIMGILILGLLVYGDIRYTILYFIII